MRDLTYTYQLVTKHLIRFVFVAMILFSIPLQSWSDNSRHLSADPALKDLSVKEVLDKIKEQTGFAIEVVGDIPASGLIGTPEHIVLPRDIARLARWLGIKSYAAQIDYGVSTITFLVFRIMPREGSSDLEISASGTDQGSIERDSLPEPYLTATEEESVISFYNQLQGSFPEIDTSITQEDKQDVIDGVPLGEPYLTTAEEEMVVSYYNQQKGSIPEKGTSPTQNNKRGLIYRVPLHEPYLTTAEGEAMISFYNQQKNSFPEIGTLVTLDDGSGLNGMEEELVTGEKN